MSQHEENMLGGETLSEQEAAKEFNGENAASSVAATIKASAKKKQGARRGDKLGTKDEPGVLAGAGNGSDTPGQTAKLESVEEDFDISEELASMDEEDIDAFLEDLDEDEINLVAEELELSESDRMAMIKRAAEKRKQADFIKKNGVTKVPAGQHANGLNADPSKGKKPYKPAGGSETKNSSGSKPLVPGSYKIGSSRKEDVDFSDDINALCESEATLSESFKEKATLIFEAAYTARIAEEVQRLEEAYNEALVEHAASIQDELVEKVDAYMSYVVESWMKENELAIETSLRADIAESFMRGLQSVFTEHYVEVPESKVDLVD